jgi:hypothetical protein
MRGLSVIVAQKIDVHVHATEVFSNLGKQLKSVIIVAIWFKIGSLEVFQKDKNSLFDGHGRT